MNRIVSLAAPAFLFCALHLLPGPRAGDARADAGDPADWSSLAPVGPVRDLLWHEGELWGAALPGGVLIYTPASRSFRRLDPNDGLGSNRARCLALSPGGEIWIGTGDAGISRVLPDGRVRLFTALPGQLDVRDLAFNGEEVYYGGPDGGGRIVSGLLERSFTEDNGLPSDDVRAVAARGEKAWFATAAGIGEFDIQRNDVITLNAGLTDLDVRDLALAGGRVYAMATQTVFVLDESTPGAETWTPVQPALDVDMLALAGRGDRLAVLGAGRQIWTRTDPAAAWEFSQPGSGEQILFALAIDEAGAIHAAGRRNDRTRIGNDVTPLFIPSDGSESPYYRMLFGPQFDGLGVDLEGGAWVGAFPVEAGVNHWRADGSNVVYDAEDSGNRTDGYNGDGWMETLKNDIHVTGNGDVWVSTFQRGLTRLIPHPSDDPALATYEHITPVTSELDMDRVRSISEDPFGHLWFSSPGEVISGSFNNGIDILLDPENPDDPAQWVHIRDDNSLLGGTKIFNVGFEGNRAAWIAVGEVGIQRFEYGTGSGIDPARLNDEASWRTIRSLLSQEENLKKVQDIRVGSDGLVWVATDGEGLFSFRYIAGAVTSARNFNTGSLSARLLADNLSAISFDGGGNLWVATTLGLNRMQQSEEGIRSDAYTDLPTYLQFGLGVDYSSQILRPLAGNSPVAVEYSPAANALFAVTGNGITRVELGAGPGRPGEGEGVPFGLYPNPVREGELLRIDEVEGTVQVEIFDLQGRALRRTEAEAGDVIWRLETLSGTPVANGLYLVRVSRDGRSTAKVVAVER